MESSFRPSTDLSENGFIHACMHLAKGVWPLVGYAINGNRGNFSTLQRCAHVPWLQLRHLAVIDTHVAPCEREDVPRQTCSVDACGMLPNRQRVHKGVGSSSVTKRLHVDKSLSQHALFQVDEKDATYGRINRLHGQDVRKILLTPTTPRWKLWLHAQG